MYSLHLTHPKWTHTRSSGQPCYSARGAVGGSVPCSRTPQSWYWRRILPPPTIPARPEIRTHNLPLTSPTRYPLGHDCPLNDGFVSCSYSLLKAAGLEWCGLLWCFYQLFGLSFWWHPFTVEVPLLSKWCNATFLQISSHEETEGKKNFSKF